MSETGDFPALLHAARTGDAHARDQLIPIMYQELHRLATYYMSAERPGHTLQATALVNEAFLRLSSKQPSIEKNVEDRQHFLALSAQTMRHVLMDHARTKKRVKRGGNQLQVTLTDWMDSSPIATDQLLELDDALNRLKAFDERAANAVELMYFGGLSYDEIAAHLGVGRSTVYEDVKAAKAWLASKLQS